MRINKYNKFILLENINEFITESQLLVGKDYLSILKSVNMINVYSETDLLIYNLSKDLLFMVNKDFSSPVNNLEVAQNNLISFIPEDKISYNDVSIQYNNIVPYSDVLMDLGIPSKEFKTKETLNRELKNSYKVIKKVDINNLEVNLPSYRNKIIYHLQNNEDVETFVILSVTFSEKPFINNSALPENRKSEAKIGRIITKLLDSNKNLKNKYSNSTIEKFINIFVSHNIERVESFDNFKIVEGEDIRKWYSEDSYKKLRSGELGNSCMRFKRCQKYLDIYTNNPEVCKLLILLDDDNKLVGRALLWTLIDGGKVIDRIYTIKDSLSQLFLRWASNNDHLIIKSYEQSSIKVKPVRYSKYPYMDNFNYYLPEKGILTNSHNFTPFKNLEVYKKSFLDTLKNPLSIINKETPKNSDLLFIINDLDGGYSSSYVTK